MQQQQPPQTFPFQASGKKIPYELCPRRPGDVGSSYATCERAEKELGWKSKLTLFDMCKDTWNWQSKNPQGYSKQPMQTS